MTSRLPRAPELDSRAIPPCRGPHQGWWAIPVLMLVAAAFLLAFALAAAFGSDFGQRWRMVLSSVVLAVTAIALCVTLARSGRGA